MLKLFLVLSCAAAAFGQLLPEEAHPAPEPYSFAFSSPNEDGTSSSREETGDASGRITGSYTLLGADGQQRRVEYVADENGFRANVITNEIGTESQNPGDVQLVSSAPTAAELSHQWEASGAGKLRGLGGPAVGPVIARPAGGLIGARGAIAINRGVGLVSAPVAPVGPAIVSGGLAHGRGLGLGIRAPAVAIAPAAPIAPLAPIAAPIGGLAINRGVGIAGPVGAIAAPIGGLAINRGIAIGAPVAVGPKVAGLGVAGVAPVGLGLAGVAPGALEVNQLGLGVAPLGVQNYGGLAVRGNLGAVPDASVLLLSRGQLSPQLLSGASKVVARKY